MGGIVIRDGRQVLDRVYPIPVSSMDLLRSVGGFSLDFSNTTSGEVVYG